MYFQPNNLTSSAMARVWKWSLGMVREKYSNLCLFDSSGLVEKNEICNSRTEWMEIFWLTCHTCGILNNLRRLATWMEVTEEEAPTTPDTTTLFSVSLSALEPSLQVQPPSSTLLMEPGKQKNKLHRVFFSIMVGLDQNFKHNSLLSGKLYTQLFVALLVPSFILLWIWINSDWFHHSKLLN